MFDVFYIAITDDANYKILYPLIIMNVGMNDFSNTIGGRNHTHEKKDLNEMYRFTVFYIQETYKRPFTGQFRIS